MTLFNIYDPVTFDIIEGSFAEEKPENATELMLTENWAKPRYDPINNVLYNAATPEEQQIYLSENVLAGGTVETPEE